MYKSMRLSLVLAVLILSSIPARAGSLANGVFDETFTENLGFGDPTTYVELDFRYSSVRPGSFERRELIDSNGNHWIYYFFQMPQGESRANVSWTVGGGATTASLSRSNSQFNWSSRTGISTNPFNMESGRYYLLTITSEAPSRLSGRRTDYFYFSLEEGGNVTPPNDNKAPTVNMSPVPGSSLEWQKNIFDGQGFSIIVEDPDGMADIDWNSLKVSIAGVDKTQHFMTVAGVLVDEGRLSSSQGVDFQTFVFRPDPSKFSDSHNLFNLQWNGDWPINIQICDKGGLCASADYSIYIGPFLTVESVQDLRCSGVPQKDPIKLSGIKLQNIGFTVAGKIYAALQASGTNSFWTYYASAYGMPVLTKEITSFYLDPLLMSPGFSLSAEVLDFPAEFLYSASGDDLFFYSLQSGSYKFLTGIQDTSNGAMAIYEREIQVCP